MKQRNGMIDLMRVVCCLSVVLLHMSNAFIKESFPTLFRGGEMAVEYFFVLSGFLLAASAQRADKSQPLWQSTWQIMKRRITGLYPMWAVAFVGRMIALTVDKGYTLKKLLKVLEESTSAYMMLTQLGLKDASYIRYSWYIPVLLLCTLMLYPWLFRNRKRFTYVAAPLVTLFGCTYLFHTRGDLLALQKEWLGFTNGSMVRGLSEMCLGAIAYEASMLMKQRFSGRLTGTGRTLFTLLELALMAYPLPYLFLTQRAEVQLGMLLCFAGFIAVAYTGFSRTADVVKGPVWSWLGKFSLALYLAHGVPTLLLKPVYGMVRIRLFVPIYIGFACVCALIVLYGGDLLTWLYRKGKKALLKACVQE